jgi:ABC-type Zn uptake system ZnuABC Zn-binding protein ZnuA
MKRKILKIIGIGVIGVIVLFGAFQFYKYRVRKAKVEKITIVCTTSILKNYVEEVGKDLIEVIDIVPAGMCPAHYDIKPSDIDAISRACLILSQGIEPWLNDLIKASGNKNFKKITVEGSTVPPKATEEIQTIKDALCEVDSENTPYYEANAREFISSIEKIAEGIKKKAKELQVQKYKVICIKWQEYFTRWVGFDIVRTYPPPERISLKETLKLVKMGKELNVSLVVDNLQSGTDFGTKLASEIGAAHVVSINFPGSVPGTETYVKMIEYKANQLFNAIEKKGG